MARRRIQETGASGDGVQRTRPILGRSSALFLAAVPGVLAGPLPWWMTHWELRPPFLGLELTRAVGVVLIMAGVPASVEGIVMGDRTGNVAFRE